jgi:hypothetical protein
MSARALILALALFFAGTPALAQNFTATSVASVSLGNVAAAASGDTRFTAAATGGGLSKISGAGAAVSIVTARVLVTVSCANQPACDTDGALIAVAQTGTPSNRAYALENFTVSATGGTATITNTPTTGNSISFTIGPVGRNGSKTFYLGYDFIVKGDASGAPSGTSSAGLSVTISRTNGNSPSSASGTVSASVFRMLDATSSGVLAFGTVSRPSTGSGSVSIAPGATSVTVSGTGVRSVPGSTPSTVTVGITGEGGQNFTVTVPGTFPMTGPGGTITVTTNPDKSGSQTLSGSLGGPGALTVQVGGTLPLTSTTGLGLYTGTFSVLVQYN